MPLPTPNLDDRRFQDLVDEAKRAIPRYCPEWTDHNVHDPGVTLIELFAHMVETMIFRLNRVPEKSYITFMDLMGVRLQEAAAARTDLTFWLTAPASEQITVPAGTEVATIQTAASESVTFSTDADLTIRPPRLRNCLTSPGERDFVDWSAALETPGQAFPAFESPPVPGNAFYLGFESDLSGHFLALDFDIREITGTGIDPKDPPLSWEALCKVRGGSSGWLEAEVEYEQTAGLNEAGQVALHLPPRMVRERLDGQEAFWVRCRFRQTRNAQAVYQSAPKIFQVQADSYGGTITATHAITISDEVVGRSDGLPNQSFKLQYAPVLPRRADEVVEVEREGGGWDAWDEIEHFGGADEKGRVVVIDSVGGTISFGPTVRDPKGGERQYGAIPPLGAQIRVRSYRSGGGAAGNVGAGKISVLKSSVSFVDRVKNRVEAVGGRDAETVEHAALRAPRMLRTSFRAVTAEDYEYLAREASQSVARVCCRQPRPGAENGSTPAGTVRVLVVPAVSTPARRIAPQELRLPETLAEDVEVYLNERRLLTTALKVEAPPCTQVKVEAHIKVRPKANPERVRGDVVERLNSFLNPIVGGHDGEGWPFGRDLFVSEIFAVIQGVPGVEYIEAARMSAVGQDGFLPKISLGPDGVLTSAEHEIKVVA
jgi:predicted phage baseplate assembly protein